MKGIGFESDDNENGANEEYTEKPRKKKKRLFGRKNREEMYVEESYQNRGNETFDKDQFNAIKEDTDDNGYSSNSYGSSYGMGSSYGSSSSSGYGGYSYGSGTASYGSKNFVFFNPSTYEEIKRLVEYLKQGEPAIVNLDRISDNEAQRSLDFISGAACALGGKLQRITGNYFLVTPDGYNITKPSGQD